MDWSVRRQAPGAEHGTNPTAGISDETRVGMTFAGMRAFRP
jgi:hypothetical protein